MTKKKKKYDSNRWYLIPLRWGLKRHTRPKVFLCLTGPKFGGPSRYKRSSPEALVTVVVPQIDFFLVQQQTLVVEISPVQSRMNENTLKVYIE